jgi:hypothetical protein
MQAGKTDSFGATSATFIVKVGEVADRPTESLAVAVKVKSPLVGNLYVAGLPVTVTDAVGHAERPQTRNGGFSGLSEIVHVTGNDPVAGATVVCSFTACPSTGFVGDEVVSLTVGKTGATRLAAYLLPAPST